MTENEFYRLLDLKFDSGKKPEELRSWLTDIYEQTRSAAGAETKLHIACTSELAAFCRGTSAFKASVRYYEEVLEALRPADGEVSFDYAVTVNNLAGTCRQMGELKRAEELFLQAGKMFKDCGGEKSFLYASVLNNLGLLYMDAGRNEEGLALLQRSMAILEELGGHEEDVATGLLNQAYYYGAKNQDQRAMELLTRAMRIFSELPYKNPHEISAKMLYGQLLSRTGDEEASKECLLLVLKEIEAVFGKNRDYCTALHSLASHCRKYGKKEEAAEYERQAAELLAQGSRSTPRG